MVPEPWGGADALTRDRRIAEDNLADCPLSTAYGEGPGSTWLQCSSGKFRATAARTIATAMALERVLSAIAAIVVPALGFALRASRRNRLRHRITEYLELAEEIAPQDSKAAERFRQLASDAADLLIARDDQWLRRRFDPAAIFAILFLVSPAVEAMALLERKRAEGKGRREALRCLKRHLVRVVWRTLRAASSERMISISPNLQEIKMPTPEPVLT